MSMQIGTNQQYGNKPVAFGAKLQKVSRILMGNLTRDEFEYVNTSKTPIRLSSEQALKFLNLYRKEVKMINGEGASDTLINAEFLAATTEHSELAKDINNLVDYAKKI